MTRRPEPGPAAFRRCQVGSIFPGLMGNLGTETWGNLGKPGGNLGNLETWGQTGETRKPGDRRDVPSNLKANGPCLAPDAWGRVSVSATDSSRKTPQCAATGLCLDGRPTISNVSVNTSITAEIGQIPVSSTPRPKSRSLAYPAAFNSAGVLHPFAYFAEGWDSTNPNRQAPPRFSPPRAFGLFPIPYSLFPDP